MQRTPPDFAVLISAMAESGADFVIIGGLAMTAQGSNHVTTDIDFAVSRDLENAKRVAAALAPFSPQPENWDPSLPYPWDASTVRNATILTLITTMGSVDLLGETPGVESYRALKARAKSINLYGHRVFVASIDDLIAMKTAAGRQKDHGHVLELRALKKLLEGDASA